MKSRILKIFGICTQFILTSGTLLAGGGTIEGVVFQDKNCDGIRQHDEQLIQGVAVDLLIVENHGQGDVQIQVGWTSTGVDGTYSYTDLDPSKEYLVHFIPPQGVALSPRNQGSDDTKDSDPYPQRETTEGLTVNDGETLSNVDAGLCINGNLQGYGNLMGFVFEDQNGNGIRDDHEPMVEGIQVELFRQNSSGGQLIETYTTNSHGEYMFSNIPAGQVIYVNFIAPVGYNFTSQDQGNDDSKDSDVIPVFGRSESLVMFATQFIEDLDAGIVHTPTVSITKDGHFADWDGVNPLGWDARDMTHPEDIADWENFWVTHHDDILSLSWSSYNDVAFSSAYNIFLDTNFSTNNGFEIGALRAEFLIQGDAIYEYQGTGRTWVWSRIGSVQLAFSGKRTELCLPLDLINDPFNIKFLLYGDNSVLRDGGIADYMPDHQAGLIYQVRENNQNLPPIGFDSSTQTLQGVPLIIPFEGDDPEGFQVTFSITEYPTDGVIVWEGTQVVYIPNNSFSGSDLLKYTVSDGLLDSTPATINIEVIPVSVDECPSEFSDNIYIDGLVDDWGHIPPVAYDDDDIHIMPYEADWRQLWMSHNNGFLNLAVKHDTTPFEEACTWAQTFFFDTDCDSNTGFQGSNGEYPLGADLMLQGAFLFRYTGSGHDWSWDCIDAIAHASSGLYTEYRIDRWHIGFDNNKIKVLLAGFNEAFQSSAPTDWMPEFNQDPLGYEFSDNGQNTGIPQVENEAGNTVVYRDYKLTIWGTKPDASIEGDLSINALQFPLPIEVADGQRWAFQRSFDLVTWVTIKEQVIQEKSSFLLDSEAGNTPEESFFRAILLEDVSKD